MVVRHDNTYGKVRYCPGVYFTRMSYDRVYRTNKDYSFCNELSATIYGQHNKMLLPMNRDVTQQG